jgi:ABC-type dipeptide/oligopeptide/nickel transport system permease component
VGGSRDGALERLSAVTGIVLRAVRRSVQAAGTLLGGAALSWLLLVAAPGDPARRVLQARGVQDPRPEDVAAVRAELGLDEPLLVRFTDHLLGLLQGDLGLSWRTGRPVAAELAERLPATALLTGSALLLAVASSLALGVLAAAAPGRWPDATARALALLATVVPGFVLGVVLLDVVVVDLGLGRVLSDGTWRTVGLPAFVLSIAVSGSWSRVLRAALLEAAASPALRVSAARGASPLRRMLVHQLPAALPAYLTVVGLGAAALLGGAPVVESVFTWPGVGRYAVEAIGGRDQPVVVGFVLLAVLVYVVTSLLLDLVNGLLDPRGTA